jgi:hypothetical protein
VGVVVHPVQHLTDGLLAELSHRLVHHGVEQIGPQPALGAVDDHGPHRPAGSVEQCRADDAEGEQPDQSRRRSLGQLTGDNRAEGLAQAGRAGRTERERRARTSQPSPVQPTRSGCARPP